MDRLTSSLGAGDVSTQLQALIDFAHAQKAGGLRLLTDTVFSAAGLVVPSRFELDGNGSSLVHPDGNGGTAQSAISFAIDAGTGAATQAGALTVSAGGPVPNGVIVQIAGAGAVIASQISPLTSSIGAADTALTVDDDQGWKSDGLVLIGVELISYTAYSAGTLSGLTRGALGTTAATHTAGDPVGLAGNHYAIHRGGALIPPPVRDVVGAALEWGSVGANVHGLVLDGQREVATTTLPNTYGIDFALAYRCTADDLDIHDWDHAGLYLTHGAAENDVASTVTIRNIGEPGFRTDTNATSGACAYLFSGATRNKIRPRLTGEWQTGVFLDDRSVTARVADQPPVGNLVDIVADCTPLNAVETSIGVYFGGFVDDATVRADVDGCTRGVSILGSSQGPVTGFASRFDVAGRFRNADVGVFVAAVAQDGVIGPVVADSTVTTPISNGSATTTDVNA